MNAFMTRFLRSPALTRIKIPTPEPDELLIKVAYVSLNPTDCQSSSYLMSIHEGDYKAYNNTQTSMRAWLSHPAK
jgi:NADPH:quinone reductase-like Zn-dependent oxidoreductase